MSDLLHGQSISRFELAYRYLSLPKTGRIEIMRRLEILDDDEGFDDGYAFRLVLDLDLVAELWAEVTS